MSLDNFNTIMIKLMDGEHEHYVHEQQEHEQQQHEHQDGEQQEHDKQEHEQHDHEQQEHEQQLDGEQDGHPQLQQQEVLLWCPGLQIILFKSIL